MRALLLAGLVFLVSSACAMGCNLEHKKCLKRCTMEHDTAKSNCETSNDPVTCKQKAKDAEAACTKACDQE